jgi:tight adherence protein C
MNFTDMATLAGFLGIAIFVFVVGAGILQLQRDRVRERLAGLGGNLPGPTESFADGDLPALLTPDASTESLAKDTRLDQEIRRAGWYRRTAKRDFVAFRQAGMLFIVIVTGVIVVVIGPEHTRIVARTVVLGLAALILTWSLPRIYLRSVGNHRVKRIQRALPDALDLMTMCLTGGLSLQDAFAHVSREIAFAHPDLALELLIVKRQSELRSSEFAFQQFARRINAPEVVALTALITQGQRLGTDVVNSIREYADNMRLRRRQLADERSNKASVKILFPLAFCLLPSAFIILWGPSLIELGRFLMSLRGRTGPP